MLPNDPNTRFACWRCAGIESYSDIEAILNASKHKGISKVALIEAGIFKMLTDEIGGQHDAYEDYYVIPETHGAKQEEYEGQNNNVLIRLEGGQLIERSKEIAGQQRGGGVNRT